MDTTREENCIVAVGLPVDLEWSVGVELNLTEIATGRGANGGQYKLSLQLVSLRHLGVVHAMTMEDSSSRAVRAENTN